MYPESKTAIVIKCFGTVFFWNSFAFIIQQNETNVLSVFSFLFMDDEKQKVGEWKEIVTRINFNFCEISFHCWVEYLAYTEERRREKDV